MTPELKQRIQQKFRIYFCEDCEGWAVRGQSPSFPEGQMCEKCNSTGFIDDGSHMRDLEATILNVIEDYIKEFSGRKNS